MPEKDIQNFKEDLSNIDFVISSEVNLILIHQYQNVRGKGS